MCYKDVLEPLQMKTRLKKKGKTNKTNHLLRYGFTIHPQLQIALFRSFSFFPHNTSEPPCSNSDERSLWNDYRTKQHRDSRRNTSTDCTDIKCCPLKRLLRRPIREGLPLRMIRFKICQTLHIRQTFKWIRWYSS